MNEDGGGPSIWDTFSHSPGKTHHGDTGVVADDSYHRYKGDVALMKQLELTPYRFRWRGHACFERQGAANPKGLDSYYRWCKSF